MPIHQAQRPNASDALDEVVSEQPLTSRERQCLDLLSEGLGAGEIAFRLGLKKVTVDLHVRNAKRKLRSKTREQAVAVAIRQAEEKYRKVFDSAGDAMFIYHQDGTILDANASASSLYGFSIDELTSEGMKIEDIVVAAQLDTTHSSPIESRERKRDGTQFDAEVTFSSFQHARNHHYLAVVRDVSPKKAAERALREGKARLQAVLDSAADIIFMKDRDLRFTHANKAMLEFNGATMDDFLGKTDADFLPPEEAEKIRIVDRTVLTGQTLRVEYTVTAGGKPRDVEVVKVPVRDIDGSVIGICGVSREVTERKRAERILRNHNANLLAILDNFPDGVTLKDTEGRLLYFNRHYRERGGLTASEHLGCSVYDLYPREIADEVWKQEQLVMRTKKPKLFYISRTYQGTDLRRLIVLRFPILAAPSDVVGVGAIAIDITDFPGNLNVDPVGD